VYVIKLTDFITPFEIIVVSLTNDIYKEAQSQQARWIATN